MLLYNIINFTYNVSSKIIDYCVIKCQTGIISYIKNQSEIKTINCISSSYNNTIKSKLNSITYCLCNCINNTVHNKLSSNTIYYSNMSFIFYVFIILILFCLCFNVHKKNKSIRLNTYKANISVVKCNKLPTYEEIDNVFITEELIEPDRSNDNTVLITKYDPPNYNDI